MTGSALSGNLSQTRVSIRSIRATALPATAVDNNETISPSYGVWERWSRGSTALINKGNSVRLVRLDGKPIPELRPQL
jgi:hypothetical protein